MSVGRNELCPCGSGRKYKKCCGIVTPIQELRTIREQRLRKEYATWIERLNRSVPNYLGEADMEAARRRFVEEAGLTAADATSPEWTPHLLNWLVMDAVHDGQTILEQFIRREGRRMDRETQQAFRSLSLGVYEVVRREDDALIVADLIRRDERLVVGISGVEPQPGQILIGRLMPLGQRDQLFSGSMILPPQLKQPLAAWMERHETDEPGARAYLRERVPELYRLVVERMREKAAGHRQGEAPLVRREYRVADQREQLAAALVSHPVFELKKRDDRQEIWVYAARKEEALFPELGDALLEMHEVAGEVILDADTVVIEAFVDPAEEAAKLLGLHAPFQERAIPALTSTGKRLTPGTLYITSQPALSSKALQWAVQRYFADKWLTSPHPALQGLPPLLAAADATKQHTPELMRLVEHLEGEARAGVGAGRLMHVDLLRPRLSLPNRTLHPGNLLRRPILAGTPDSAYTAPAERLDELAQFVADMTEGKSEATVKKYDEAVNLFRDFVRLAFGPSFAWDALRPEDVAYFLVFDAPRRADGLTKTLANHLLSVLAALFKWLDKRHGGTLAARMQPLLSELKGDLPEAYRLRALLAKESSRLQPEGQDQPEEVFEDRLIVTGQPGGGLPVRRENGQEAVLAAPAEAVEGLTAGWLLAGVFAGTAGVAQLRHLGTLEVCPPAVTRLLEAAAAVPV